MVSKKQKSIGSIVFAIGVFVGLYLATADVQIVSSSHATVRG